MRYVTRGCGDFDISKWNDVKNEVVVKDGIEYLAWNKPSIGGLWACSTDHDVWKKELEYYGIKDDIDSKFEFVLTDNVRILHLRSYVDAVAARDKYSRLPSIKSHLILLNFEDISKDYDVVAYHLSDDPDRYTMGDNLYWRMYGWDIDCILVLNKDVIKLL